MNLTDDQKRVLRGFHAAFSKRMIKARIVPRGQGMISLDVHTPSGLWQVEISTDGRLHNPRFTQSLLAELDRGAANTNIRSQPQPATPRR